MCLFCEWQCTLRYLSPHRAYMHLLQQETISLNRLLFHSVTFFSANQLCTPCPDYFFSFFKFWSFLPLKNLMLFWENGLLTHISIKSKQRQCYRVTPSPIFHHFCKVHHGEMHFSALFCLLRSSTTQVTSVFIIIIY